MSSQKKGEKILILKKEMQEEDHIETAKISKNVVCENFFTYLFFIAFDSFDLANQF